VWTSAEASLLAVVVGWLGAVGLAPPLGAAGAGLHPMVPGEVTGGS